jgi:hypothetical protein
LTEQFDKTNEGAVMKLRMAMGSLAMMVILSGCGDQSVMSLAVGDCFDDTTELLSGADITRVPDVDCAEPHDNEVFHVVDYPGSSYVPTAIDDFAIEQCYSAFSRYVGRDYESSALDFAWLLPSRDGWASGDREVVCVAYRMDLQKLRGSVRGSGI